MSNCLVLGANGFIGSHLVDKLVEQGYRVRAFDRFGDRPVNFTEHANIEIFNGDFLNQADVDKALEGIEYVFHLVSTTTPATAEDDPLIDVDTNIHNSIQLFQNCARQGIKKIVFASSSAVYGDTEKEIIDEQTNPQPISPYTIGKLTIEHYLRYFNKKSGIASLTYRISNPYGERHSPLNRQGVIPIFLHHIAAGEPITLLGDGTMVRDYLYVGDVAELIAKTFVNAKQSLYNLASGQGVSLNELVETIKKVTGRDIKIESKPKPATFLQKTVLDTSRFNSEFGLKPTTSLEDGVRKTWQYVLDTQHNK